MTRKVNKSSKKSQKNTKNKTSDLEDYLKAKEFYIILLIFAFAVIPRLWKLGELPGLTTDENFWLDIGKKIYLGEAYPTLTKSIWAAHPIHGSFSNFLIAISYQILGVNIFSGRLPFAIAGTLTVIATYFLTKELFDRKTGIVASILFALSPWHIALSRIAWPISLVVLYDVIFLYSFLRGKEKNNQKFLYIAGISAGLGLQSHQYAIITILITAFLYINFVERSLNLYKNKYLQVAILLGVLTIAPMVYYNFANDLSTYRWYQQNRLTKASVEQNIVEGMSAFYWTIKHVLIGEEILINFYPYLKDKGMVGVFEVFLLSLLIVLYLSFNKTHQHNNSSKLLVIWFFSAMIFSVKLNGYGRYSIGGPDVVAINNHYLDVVFPLPYIIIATAVIRFLESTALEIDKRSLNKMLIKHFVIVATIGILVVQPSFFIFQNYFKLFEKNCPPIERNPTYIKAAEYITKNAGGKAVITSDSEIVGIIGSKDLQATYYYYPNVNKFYNFDLGLIAMNPRSFDAGDIREPLNIFLVFGPQYDIDLVDGKKIERDHLKSFLMHNPNLNSTKTIPSCDNERDNILIFHIPSYVHKYSEVQFDFGTQTSPAAEKFIPVADSAPYTPINGFGWDWIITDAAGLFLNTEPIYDTNRFRYFGEFGWTEYPIRNATSYYQPTIKDPLLSDGFLIFSDSTFLVDVPDGVYEVSTLVAIAEPRGSPYGIRIYAEKEKIESGLEIGRYSLLKFNVSVNDGQLNIRFSPIRSIVAVAGMSLQKIA